MFQLWGSVPLSQQVLKPRPPLPLLQAFWELCTSNSIGRQSQQLLNYKPKLSIFLVLSMYFWRKKPTPHTTELYIQNQKTKDRCTYIDKAVFYNEPCIFYINRPLSFCSGYKVRGWVLVFFFPEITWKEPEDGSFGVISNC